MAAKNVADGLVRDPMTQIGHRADNAVIAPTGILSRHLHHQLFHFLLDSRSAPRFVYLGAVELLGYQFAIPGQDGVGFGDAGDLLQRFTTQALGDLGQRGPLTVGQSESPFDLRPQNSVLGHQVSKQQFLIHQARHVREQADPVVFLGHRQPLY